MKTKFLILLFVCFLISCQKNNKTVEKAKSEIMSSSKQENLIKDILKFDKYASSYEPNKIDFSDNKDLNNFDLNFIYNNDEYKNEEMLKQHITNVLLLKQYLFHLTNYNQGYNLLTMRNAQAKFIINYFLDSNKISSEKEFINSGYPYELLKDKKITDKEIAELIKAISKQESRILNQ